MQLTFRDLKQQRFTIDAEPSETVGQVKEKIAQEKGWDAASQKLIYSGKILQDANTVESYKIEEKGFIVCMVSKPKAPAASAQSSSKAAPSTPAPAAAASSPAPPAAPAPASSNTTANAPSTPTPAPAATTGAAAENPASFNDPSALLVGTQGESVIGQMEAMGFPRAEIDRAMRAAFFNPDRAIEYLLNGIPENVQTEQQPATPAAGAGTGARGTAGTTPAAATTNPTPAATAPTNQDDPVDLFEMAAQANLGGGGGRGGAARGAGAGAGAAAGGLAGLAAGAGEGGNLDFLRDNAHFQQLRQLVQQQPGMLEPILQQLGAGNPQLAQIIGQNQEQFLQLLSEDLDEDAPAPPGAHNISVTEEERDAIERLCRLGFPRNSVIQAYFACDKNEELAANFLFDQPDEGDEQ